jgi:feruloyl esterase
MAKYFTQNTTIDQFAEGTNVTCALPNPVVPVDLCRVALNFPTSESSEVYMEAWLPEKWNQRFLAVGTGGLTGCKPSERQP